MRGCGCRCAWGRRSARTRLRSAGLPAIVPAMLTSAIWVSVLRLLLAIPCALVGSLLGAGGPGVSTHLALGVA